MTINFFLPQKGIYKNIHFNFTDLQKNKKYTFRTSLKITAENWDQEKQRPVNVYLKKYKDMNAKLGRLKLEITQHIFQKRKEGKTVLQRVLGQEIKRICAGQKKEHPENSLLYYMKYYIESKKELICYSTYKRYNVFYHLLERFEGFLSKRLYIEEVNSDFMKDFILFGKDEEYSDNTIYRTIHFVKTILNFAERKGIRTCVRELEIRREKQHKEIVTLTESEITQIKLTEVPEDLKAAKDWLLISCYTGQRFSDFICFSEKQLIQVNEKVCIGFTQQKTGKEITLPLHPVVIDIIEKNKNSFPISMDIRHYNDCIKKIAKISGLDYSLKAKKRIGYRVKNLLIPKWEFLTSHIGRRSFATNFYGKIPTPLLMEATGHSSEQMFLRYINPTDKDRIMNLGNYFNQTYKDSHEVIT